jgi:hypothetical protein
MTIVDGIRVPAAGETWAYFRCKRHMCPNYYVLIRRDFGEQNEFFQRQIMSQSKHGCFVPAHVQPLPYWDYEKSE